MSITEHWKEKRFWVLAYLSCFTSHVLGLLQATGRKWEYSFSRETTNSDRVRNAVKLACVASVSVQFGSKELQGDEWSELGLSLLPNPTETLATQATVKLKSDALLKVLPKSKFVEIFQCLSLAWSVNEDMLSRDLNNQLSWKVDGTGNFVPRNLPNGL